MKIDGGVSVEELITIRDMCKIYNPGENEVRALDHVNLTIHKNEFVAIIGQSGSGKSTLLRCATLLETMDGGSLSYMGKSAVTDVNGAAVYAPSATLKEIRGYFGLVFQNFNLFPHYNVLKNIHRKSEIPGIKQRFFRQMIPLVLLTGEGSRIVSRLPVLDMKLRRKHIMLCVGC